jgi:hypothetical protein
LVVAGGVEGEFVYELAVEGLKGLLAGAGYPYEEGPKGR